MSNKLTKKLLLASVCLSSMSVSSTVIAQDEVAGLEEIIVTARRREETLQNVPIAVTAFTSAALELRGVSDITELAMSAPSVTLEASRATNSTLTAFIRGVGQQDPLAGFEQGVAMYVDDVYLARPQGALLEVYDVERIEILRGPQGTLYGRNAVGGAIKYVTKRLGEEAEYSLKGNLGTFEQIDLVGSMSAPISDTIRVGAAVASLNRGGFGDNLTTGEDHYDKDIMAMRASIEFLPNEDVFVRIAADYTNDKSNARAGYRGRKGALSGTPVTDSVYDTYAGASANASTAGIDGNNEVTAKGIAATIEWNASDTVMLKSITSYREDYTESVIDFDGGPTDDFDAPVIYDNDQFSQELQLQYNSDSLNVISGFYYLNSSASNDFDVVLGQLIPGLPITAYTGGVVDTKAWSIFADATYSLSDDFNVSVGGRYTNDKRSADVFRANYFSIGSPAFGVDATPYAVNSDYESERTDKKFTPRVALDYSVSDDVTVYTSYSVGFKAGSFDPRGANLAPGGDGVQAGFDPETVTTIEAGLKSTFADGRARLNIAIFNSKYKDMQVPGSLPYDSDDDGTNDSFLGTVTNAARSTIKGIEIEGDFALSDSLTLKTSLSILDAELKEWLVSGVDISDTKAMQNTPEFMSYVGLHYKTEMNDGTLNVQGSWARKGKTVQFEDPNPFLDQAGYSMFDANIVWVSSDDKYTIGLHGKNLTDREIKTAGYNFPTLGKEWNVTTFYAPPRTITASFSVKF